LCIKEAHLKKEVHTFKYPDRSWKIVDTSCGFQSSNYDTRRGDEIVCKGVVEIPLWQSVYVLGLPPRHNHSSECHM
jgi:hypothetical protein